MPGVIELIPTGSLASADASPVPLASGNVAKVQLLRLGSSKNALQADYLVAGVPAMSDGFYVEIMLMKGRTYSVSGTYNDVIEVLRAAGFPLIGVNESTSVNAPLVRLVQKATSERAKSPSTVAIGLITVDSTLDVLSAVSAFAVYRVELLLLPEGHAVNRALSYPERELRRLGKEIGTVIRFHDSLAELSTAMLLTEAQALYSTGTTLSV